MIKRVIPLAALVFSSSAIAQVGIGTQKPATSAQLDIVATDKGVLLPRVQLNTINDHSVIKGKIEKFIGISCRNLYLGSWFLLLEIKCMESFTIRRCSYGSQE